MKDDGSLGPRNDFRPASIEHKLGIHGSPTCVMLYEGAQAELVGELGQGLPHMFIMMNAARLLVGVQGVAIAERAFQQALAFAQERKQGRTTWDADGTIYGHPDVRRMLMLMKAKTEAARAICLTTGGALRPRPPGRQRGGERHRSRPAPDCSTPIAKAWSTDIGVEVASLGVQVHGGMGFIEETGAAQHFRDARIAPIYEGNKWHPGHRPGGPQGARWRRAAVMGGLCGELALTKPNVSSEVLGHWPPTGRRLAAGVAALERATDWLASQWRARQAWRPRRPT